MAIVWEIQADIVAWVDQASFNKAKWQIKEFARDTGKELDQAKKQKLELDISRAKINLESWKRELKSAKDINTKQRLLIDTNEAQSNLTEAKRKLQNFRNTGDETTSRLQKKFDWLWWSVKEFWGIIAGVFAFDKIVDLWKSIFSLTASYQKYQAVLTNTFGSQTEAIESMELIKDIASSTPFEINKLTESYIKLVNRWFKPTRAEIISLWDLASSQWKDFDQLTEAILDAQTGEFERLKEFWVKAKVAGDNVTFTFKWQAVEVAKTEEAIKNYVLSLWNLEWVSGSMAVIAETLWGRFSNILDKLTQIWTEIWLRLVPFFEKVTEGFLSLISSEAWLYWIAGAVTAIWVAIAFATGWLTAIVWWIVALTAAWWWLTAWLWETQNRIPWLTDNLKDTQTAIDELNEKFNQWVISVEEYVSKMADLEVALKNAQDEYDAVNDRINNNNEKVEENSETIEKVKRRMIAYLKIIGELTDKYWENDAQVISIKKSLSDAKVELAGLSKESEDAKKVNDFLQWSFWGLSSAINSVTTAKTRSEFNKLRLNAVNLLKTFALVWISQLKEARASGDTELEWAIISRLKTISDSAAQIKTLEFQSAKDQGAAENTKTNNTKSGASKRTGSRKQETNDAVKELEKQKKADEDKRKAEKKELEAIQKERAKFIEEQKKEREKLAKEDQKILDDFAKSIQKRYETAGKEIGKIETSIEKLGDKIADTQAKIDQATADGSSSIAERAVELEKLLKDEELSAEKKIALEKELALAKSNTTEQDLERANLLATESETERIIRETEEKKSELELQLADLQTKQDAERQLLETAVADREALERWLTAFLWDQEEVRTNKAIAEFKRLAEARARILGSALPTGAWWNNTTNNNTTTNWPVTVSVNAQTNASPEAIASAVSSRIISSQKGNAL